MVKVTVNSNGSNRISITNQNRDTVRSSSVANGSNRISITNQNRDTVRSSGVDYTGTAIIATEALVKADLALVTANAAANNIAVAFNQANTALATANASANNIAAAYNQANTAYNAANTKVAKAGDTMTGHLNFTTSNTRVGNVQTDGGIDLFADVGTVGAQLNYANSNFVWVDSAGAHMQGGLSSMDLTNTGLTLNATNLVNLISYDKTWIFDANGKLTLPDGSSFVNIGTGAEFTAGPNSGSYVSLASNDANNYMWVDNDGAYIGTNWTVEAIQWIFNANGRMFIPGGGSISAKTLDVNPNSIALKPAPGGHSALASNNLQQFVFVDDTTVAIATGAITGNDKYWIFNQSGNFTFPDGTIQKTAFTGYAQDNTARSIATAAFAQANVAPDIANSYARTVGTAGNTYTNTVGTAGNSYTNTVGAAGNSYTNTVGTAGNSYARTVGTAGNTFTVVAFAQANLALSVAQTAFGQANSGLFVAQTAFGQANTALTTGQVAFARANIAPDIANSYTITVGAASNTYAQAVGSAGNSYTNSVGTAGNNYTNTVGTAGNSYTNTVGTAGNTFTVVAFAQANLALSVAQTAFGQANSGLFVAQTAFGQANTALSTAQSAFARANIAPDIANSYAQTVGTAGNTYTNTVGTAGNSYTNTVGTAGNSYARTVGTAGNTFTVVAFTQANLALSVAQTAFGQANSGLFVAQTAFGQANTALSTAQSAFARANVAPDIANSYTVTVGTASNTYAQTVGTAGNNYTREVGIASNTYAQTIGTVGNSYTNTVGTAGNNYTNSVGAGSNSYARTVGTASNTYAETVGTAGNSYTRTVGTAGNTYTNTVGTAGNNYTNSVGAAGNTYTSLAYNQANAAYDFANTRFSSSGGQINGNVSIQGSLSVLGNVSFINQQSLVVGDPLIYLAANNYTSDIVDIGFIANYVNATGSNVHTGLFRDATTKEYYAFYGYDQEPINNHVDPNGNNFTIAVLNAAIRTSNINLAGANLILTIAAGNNYTRDVGTAGNNYTNAVGAGGNSYTQTVGAAGNTFTVLAYGQANLALAVAQTAFGQANVAPDIANSYARTVGTAGNTYTQTVGTAGNNYTNSVGTAGNTYTNTVGTAGNTFTVVSFTQANLALAVAQTAFGQANSGLFVAQTAFGQANTALSTGQSAFTRANIAPDIANSYTVTVGAAGNNYTREVGTAGNTYTNTVGAAGNNYSVTVGDAGNTYARTVGTAGNNYTNIVGSASNTFTVLAYTQANLALSVAQTSFGQANSGLFIAQTAFGQANTALTTGQSAFARANIAPDIANSYAQTVGTAGNNYTREVGSASNTYTNAVGTAGNSYTNTVGTAGNNYTNAIGVAGNNYTNTVGAAGNTFTVVAFTQANLALSVAQTAFGQANTALTTGQSSFAKANTALQNTTGTFAGTLTATGFTATGLVQAGNFTAPSGYVEAQNSLGLYLRNTATIMSPFGGVIRLTDWATTSFNRLQLGGNTSSFPAIARSNANISFVLADNSDLTSIYAKNVGIGTTTPTSNLEVVGTANISTSLIVSGVNIIAAIAAANTWANTKLSNTSGAVFNGNLQVGGNLAVGSNIAAPYTFYTSGNSAVTGSEVVRNMYVQGGTNLLTYAEQFDNAAWTKSNSTVTANAVAAPDGTTTADKLVEGAPTARKYIYQSGTTSSQTFSLYAKKGERNYAAIGQTNNGGLWAVSLFDLNLGTYINSYQAGASTVPTNNIITSVGNGWYRISCTLNGSSMTSSAIMVSNGGDPIFEGYTGDGTSGIYIWGAQLEPGVIASPYIQTVASAVQSNSVFELQGSANISGNFTVKGNVTLGDASTDLITINGSTITLGNNSSIDAGTLFIDSTNDRVGIGNTVPPAKLTVAGSVLIGGDQVNLVDFRLQRNNTTKTVNHWYNSSANSPWYTYGENIIWNGERSGTVESTQASRPYYEAFSPAGGYREFGFANVTSGAVASSNLIPSLVLKNNWYVGIGTINPTSNLHVVGTANITSTLVVQGSDVTQAISAGNTFTVLAFGQANTALSTGQSAFGKANTAGTDATNAFNQANTARDVANTANNLTVANNGVVVSSRNVLNFVQGANTILSVTDDSVGNRINVTITSLGSGGGGTTDYSPAFYTANLAYAQANTANVLAFNALPNTTGAVFNGNLTVSQNLTSDRVFTLNNGNGENFKVGDDAWIGDTNLADTLRIKGQQNSANGYIQFGTNDGITLGRTGTNALTYGANTVWHAGNDGTGSGLDADLLDGQHATYFGTATNTAAAFAAANGAPDIANSYARTVGTAGNTYTNTVGTAGNNYTNTVGSASNTYAQTVGTAGNNFSISIGNAGNTYAQAVGAGSNSYTNTVGTAGNNYTITVGAAANNFSNTKLANTSGVSFAGDLTITGNVGIGTAQTSTFRLEVGGAFAATTKSFIINHPTKEGKRLRYASLEGPENGVYVRGKTTESIIELPDYWTALIDEDSITVHLTPLNGKQVSVKKIEGNKVYLNKPWIGGINCFYIIFAERKDVEKLIVEI